MQELSIEMVDSLAREIAERKLVFSAKFVNVTPWWGGGPFADTILCLDEECKQLDYALPNSETVKGLLRWVLRTLYASIENANYIDIEEKYIVSLLGSTSSESKIHVMVESRICCEKPYYASYSTLEQLVKCYVGDKNITKSKAENLLTSFELIGHVLLRGQDPSNINNYFLRGKRAKEQKGEAKKLCSCINILGPYKKEAAEFAKLFTIPRFRLISMKVTSKDVFPHKNSLVDVKYFTRLLFSLQPLKPGCVETRVDVYWSPRSPALEESRDKRFYEELLTLSVLYVFSVLGLGKATSRGFGRFKLKDTQSSNQNIVKAVEELSSCLWTPNRVKDCLEKMHGLFLEILEKLYNRKPMKELSRIPKLSATEIFAGELRHPCRLATQELTNRYACEQYCDRNRRTIVKDVVEALSAIGKATLKSVWKIYARVDVKKPGIDFHTWILGLPRRPQRTTGYALDEKGILKGDNARLNHRDLEEFSDGRRKSPFFIYPVCSNNNCNVVILFFKTLHDHLNIINKLVHIGECRSDKGFHVERVIAANITGIPELCGSATGHISKNLRNTVSKSEKVAVIIQVEETAFKWLKYILSV